jgi:hypothetical protein
MRRLETLGFWPDLLRLKDELSLREMAVQFGVTPGAISAALKREGVTRVPAPPGPRGGRIKDTGLSQDGTDRSVARTRPGSKDADIVAHYSDLGRVPDADIAMRAGVSVRTIASFRARHDISGYRGPRRKPVSGRRKRSKVDPYVHLLGQVPDRVVAEQANVSLNAVRQYRVKVGIMAAGRQTKVALPAKVPDASHFATGVKHAWRVFARHSGAAIEGIVIAEDLSKASASVGLKGAVVTRIEWVGALL